MTFIRGPFISIAPRGGSAGPNGAPSGLTLTVLSPTSNKLDWTNGSTDETAIIVQRSDDGGGYSNLVWLAPGTITYDDTSALVGILYYYRIVLIKGSLYSAYSNVVNNLNGDITTGLVGQWLFDEESGAVAIDTSTGGHNGNIVGAVRTIGRTGNGLAFNGIPGNNVVRIGDFLDSTFAGTGKKFTIVARIKPAATMTNNCIVAKYFSGTGGQREIVFTITTGSKLRFLWYGALDGTIARGYTGTTTSITDTTKWYDVMITYDQTLPLATRVGLFIDNVAEPFNVDVSSGTPDSIQDGTAKLAIGAYNFGDDSTTTNFNGKIDSVNIFNRIITYSDALLLNYVSHVIPDTTAKLYNFNAGSLSDVFIDDLYGQSISGLFYQISKPVKYINNPIGVNADIWDYQRTYPNVYKIGANYKLWYTCVPNPVPIPYYTLMAYAESTDGLSFTKPDLGIVTVGGSNHNNCIIGLGAAGLGVVYDPEASADMRYVASLTNNPSIDGGWEVARKISIYKSADGITWTKIKEFTPAGNPYIETNELIKRDDGRWIVYYIADGLTDSRKIAAFLSDTNDITGAWTDQGVIMGTTVNTDQKYSMSCALHNGIYYGSISKFNSVSQQITIDLYTSRDGLVWTRKVKDWIFLGSEGAWDSQMLFGGKSTLVLSGNDWRLYYAGVNSKHNEPPFNSQIGIVTIGNNRIGGLVGIGTYTTTAFTPTEPLIINADLTHGTLKVELLAAADNSVIAGYSKDDMDALSGDIYSTEVKWGGNSILTDRSLKIKFYLT